MFQIIININMKGGKEYCGWKPKEIITGGIINWAGIFTSPKDINH